MLANEKGLTNKCVSERHYHASLVKMTVGEAAKYITKKVGRKVLAKDVKDLYLTHYGQTPEWHHSGFYKGGKGRTMGRTFFLSEDEAQTLVDNYQTLVQKLASRLAKQSVEETRQRETVTTGFYWTWGSDYGGSYGKKRKFKVLHAYEGNELSIPSSNFTPCDASLLPAIKANEGKKYFGWDEPKLEEFER